MIYETILMEFRMETQSIDGFDLHSPIDISIISLTKRPSAKISLSNTEAITSCSVFEFLVRITDRLSLQPPITVHMSVNGQNKQRNRMT